MKPPCDNQRFYVPLAERGGGPAGPWEALSVTLKLESLLLKKQLVMVQCSVLYLH